MTHCRYVLQEPDLNGALAIGFSLFLIVLFSVTIGAALPLIYEHVGIDPVHAGTSIQVLMVSAAPPARLLRRQTRTTMRSRH